MSGLTLIGGLVGSTVTSAALVLTSLSNPVGDTAGGGVPVVIEGLGLTGATGVKFGVTDATSFVIDSPTQITAVRPPLAIGEHDVTVVKGALTSNPLSYQAWDPSALATGGRTVALWQQGGYSKVGGVGTWVPRFGAGNFVGGAASPGDANGEPNCAGVANQSLTCSAAPAAFWQQGSGWTTVIGMKPTAAVGSLPAFNTDPSGLVGLLTITGGGSNWGQHFTTSGYTSFYFNGSGFGPTNITLPLAINTWAIAFSRHDTASAYTARLGKGAFTAYAPPSASSFPNPNTLNGGSLIACTNDNGAAPFTGVERFILLVNAAITDPECDTVYAWAASLWSDFPP